MKYLSALAVWTGKRRRIGVLACGRIGEPEDSEDMDNSNPHLTDEDAHTPRTTTIAHPDGGHSHHLPTDFR